MLGYLMSTITVRHYNQGDEHGIVNLFKEVFGREMSLDEWRWKYKGQGNQRVYSSVGVTQDNRVVAHYGGIPLPAVYKGKEIKVLSVCDVMIHPKFRGIKALRKITSFHRDEALKIGFAMCPGFPTENTLMLPTEKLGLIERVLTVMWADKEVGLHNNVNRFLYRFFPLSFEDARIDKLWEIVKSSLTFSLVRDRRYFSWRYKNHPLYNYECWGLKKIWSRNLSGMAIIKKDSEDKTLVMDMLFMPDTIIALLQKAENIAYSSGRKVIALWLPAKWHPLLTRLGYILREYGAVGRDTNNAIMDKEEMAAHFFYTMGDTDYL